MNSCNSHATLGKYYPVGLGKICRNWCNKDFSGFYTSARKKRMKPLVPLEKSGAKMSFCPKVHKSVLAIRGACASCIALILLGFSILKNANALIPLVQTNFCTSRTQCLCGRNACFELGKNWCKNAISALVQKLVQISPPYKGGGYIFAPSFFLHPIRGNSQL